MKDKSSGTYQDLVYADDINLLVRNKNDIKKNTESLLIAIKKFGLEMNIMTVECKFNPRHQDAGRSNSTNVGENVSKYWQSPNILEQN